MAKRKLKKALSDDQKIARIEQWSVQLGLPKETAKQLTEKYGMYAYDLMAETMMRPATMKIKDGKSAGSSKATAQYLVEQTISPEVIAQITKTNVDTIKKDLAEFQTEQQTATPTQLTIDIAQLIANHNKAQNQFDNKVDKNTTTIDAPQQTAIPQSEAEWIEKELTKMKKGKTGELSFAEMQKMGITDQDMQNALTEDQIKEVHAGPVSKKLAKSAQKIEKQMSGSGLCLSGVQYATADTLGICYGNYKVERLKGSTSNSACFSHQAWEQSGKFQVFKFKNDIENGNPCLRDPQPCEGAIINFDRGQTMHGHVTISKGCKNDKNLGWDCDIHQQADRIASGVRADGKQYGENFYLSFTNDCTVSDDLARKMLHERYVRENPQASQTMVDIKATSITQAQQDSIQQLNVEKLREMSISR